MYNTNIHKKASARFTPLFIGVAVLLVIAVLFFVTRVTESRNQTAQAAHIQGRTEGVNTRFAIANSSFLNLTLESSSEIRLVFESMPNMVRMQISPVAQARSTQITLKGFHPRTTYYKYQDDYHQMAEFVSDARGNYTYTQDISTPHFVFIQSQKSTVFIKDDAVGGDCARVGTWDSATKTCVLATDLNETIQIDSDGVSLDGNGHTVTGSNTGSGVFLSFRTGVTVKNLKLTQFFDGVSFYQSNNNIITNLTLTNNTYGVRIDGSGNTVENNNLDANNLFGIYLESGRASRNSLVNNKITDGNWGIYLYFAGPQNVIQKNVVTLSKLDGIRVLYTPEVTIVGNEIMNSNVNQDGYAGIYIGRRTAGTVYNVSISENVIYGSGGYGIFLDTYPYPLDSPEKIAVYRNSISGNRLFSANSVYPIELSYNGEGNEWGHDSPPCFREGDSNDIRSVVDSYPVCKKAEVKDVTPPVISMPNIPAEVPLNSTIQLVFSATDDLSGVAKLTAKLDGVTVENGQSLVMSNAGPHLFVAEAVDNAGNARIQELAFSVVYAFGGFREPTKTDGSGTYHQGRDLPVKFRLTDTNGTFVGTAKARLSVAKIVNGNIEGSETIVATAFVVKGDQYALNLSTKNMTAGTWRLKVILDDGKSYAVQVVLR